MQRFELTEAEEHAAHNWARSHKCHVEAEGPIKGKLTYCFRPTSVMTTVRVMCVCGQEHDLTDYSCW